MNKKESIELAALKLFVEKGEQASSMKLIAKEAGCGMGTLYNYFLSKEVLMHELFLSVKDDLDDFIFENYNPKAAVKQRFTTAWLRVIDYGLSNPHKFQFFSSYTDSCKAGEDLNQKYTSKKNHFREIFEDGKNEGVIKDMDSLQLIIFNKGAVTKSIIRYPNMSQEQKNELLTMMWDAVKS